MVVCVGGKEKEVAPLEIRGQGGLHNLGFSETSVAESYGNHI